MSVHDRRQGRLQQSCNLKDEEYMSSFDFKTATYGKWILAGEHAVLRGQGALVFPILSKRLFLCYNADADVLRADFYGLHRDLLHLLFWSVLEHALCLLGRNLHQIKGSFSLTNEIPIGAGMGASAALCVAVARWFLYWGWLQTKDLYHFAQALENLFHGKSSGLDIHGVSATQGIYFHRGKTYQLKQNWIPTFYLSFCGQQALTSTCIEKVEMLWKRNKKQAQAIDYQMAVSVEKAKTALSMSGSSAYALLVESMDIARTCFESWGLTHETMHAHMQWLKNKGALAVKPTGSGGGGYILSLWEAHEPFNPFSGSEIDCIRIADEIV